MKRSPHIPTLLAAVALSGVAAVPAIAHKGDRPGGPGGRDAAVLDEDLSLTGDLAITAAGTTRTRTFTDDDGDSHTIVSRRGIKAAGDVTSDIKTAAGADPGALTAKVKLKTRTRDNTRGRVEGTLTVRSADGTIRMRIKGRRFDDGTFEARIRGARGKGSFAKVRIGADADVTIDDDSVRLDVDGEYGYPDPDDAGDRRGGDRRGPGGEGGRGPRG